MKTITLCFLFISLLMNDSRADLVCSDAESKIKFETSQYKGGQAPQPGTLIREEKLTIQNNVISHSMQFEMCEDPSDPRKKENQIGKVETQFLNTVVLIEKNLPYGFSKTFSVLASFRLNENAASQPSTLPILTLPEDTYLMCQESVFFYP